MFEFLNQWHWTFDGKYAVRNIGGRKKRTKIYLHRFIMNTPDGMDTDHINGDVLDNQTDNLRICTHAQNIANGKFRSNNKSGYKGIHQDKRTGKWCAVIWKDSKYIWLGSYNDINDAIEAYKNASIKYFGEFYNSSASMVASALQCLG